MADHHPGALTHLLADPRQDQIPYRAVSEEGCDLLQVADERQLLFDDETTAGAAAKGLHVGDRAENAPEGVIFRTVQVQQVIAHL